jgi:hypothetical protein
LELERLCSMVVGEMRVAEEFRTLSSLRSFDVRDVPTSYLSYLVFTAKDLRCLDQSLMSLVGKLYSSTARRGRSVRSILPKEVGPVLIW